MSETETEFVRERIVEHSNELFRPIIQHWVRDDVVGPDAFKLSTADKNDANRLSVSRGEVVTAEQAYNARAESIKQRCDDNGKPFIAPVGVLSVTVGEVESVEVKSAGGATARNPLTVWDDSMNDSRANDHGHIDYNDLPPSDKGAHELAAKALLAKAKQNGWKYRP
ncbi:hypothetical protein [Rhodococcoides fascians]|uniref:hypothetical protein n=1 Tax=Rhodococcoides fascians TaxID=1828 RepID=UPI00050CB276|nr:hypothetical protein [Rhodococcus fascians]